MNTFLAGKIIEISGEGYFLKKNRGFLQILKNREIIGSVSLDDIQAIIFNSYDLTYTNKVITELGQRKIPVIFCNDKHLPTNILLPFDSYFHQSRRIRCQAQAQIPLNKKLWKQIVTSKIVQQGFVLEYLDKESEYLFKLAGEVRSNDNTNCEAQAARYYFSKLFGPDFCRDRDLEGINAMLNYGYIVLRSAVARAVVACGLHPSIGIKHCSPTNSMPLVDDILEPFRPFIDLTVYNLAIEQSIEKLTKFAKKAIVDSLAQTITAADIKTTPNNMIYKTVSSLGNVYDKDAKNLTIPPMSP